MVSRLLTWGALSLVGATSLHHKGTHDKIGISPPPPAPEPIDVIELPLPPVVSSTAVGSCTYDINPHGTGCIGTTTGLQGGNFFPDGNHVLAHVAFTGAPVAPDPRSIYNGQQVIIIKTNGELFSNGDAWKCITCGAPAGQSIVANSTKTDWSYPQAFKDGTKILAGIYIISCGETELTDDCCTPDEVSVYPIRLSNKADDSGTGASLRELRIHPDNLHIGVNSFALSAAGSLSETVYYGRLELNENPTTGLPLSPRYEIVNVSVLQDGSASAPVYTSGDQIFINNSAITVGEFRGFSGTGYEATYIGYSVEACNIDVFAVHLITGRVRRLTQHPGYCDPIEMSPDDNWMVIQDTRGSGRVEFMDGLRWLPPLTDLVTSIACSSVRNNGNRRFFQPWLLDRYGDRGDYYGQSLNNAHLGQYGSGAIDDPQWNGQADPWFSPDGTQITYWQAQVVSPACGGSNPLPCYNSTEPGARDGRIMLATLSSRVPLPKRPLPEPFSDHIPWAVPYTPGMIIPTIPGPKAGVYTLKGSVHGSAQVVIKANLAGTGIQEVDVQLCNYSDHKSGVINGFQNISAVTQHVTLTNLDWYANISRVGDESATQITGEGGFHMSVDAFTNEFEATGTLITTVENTTYVQPLNGA